MKDKRRHVLGVIFLFAASIAQAGAQLASESNETPVAAQDASQQATDNNAMTRHERFREKSYNRKAIRVLTKGKIGDERYVSELARKDLAENHWLVKALNRIAIADSRQTMHHSAIKLLTDITRLQLGESLPWSGATYTLNQQVVRKDERLIDLERILLGEVSYAATQGRYETFDLDRLELTPRTILRSQESMSRGEPPAGPEAAEVKICRLFGYPSAEYFEMAEYKANAILDEYDLEDNMCISGDAIKYFWAARSAQSE